MMLIAGRNGTGAALEKPSNMYTFSGGGEHGQHKKNGAHDDQGSWLITIDQNALGSCIHLGTYVHALIHFSVNAAVHYVLVVNFTV